MYTLTIADCEERRGKNGVAMMMMRMERNAVLVLPRSITHNNNYVYLLCNLRIGIKK